MPVKPAALVAIRTTPILLCFLMANIFCLPGAYAQAEKVFGVIQSPGVQESYGINDLNILNSQTSASADYTYATRHRRRGEATGIGGSFLGTTAVTVETTAPAIPSIIAPVVHNQAAISNQSLSIYGNVGKTPALYGSLTKQYFDIDLDKAMQKPIISPALTVHSQSSWAAIESPLIKKPAAVIEPLEQINLHRTVRSPSFPY